MGRIKMKKIVQAINDHNYHQQKANHNLYISGTANKFLKISIGIFCSGCFEDLQTVIFTWAFYDKKILAAGEPPGLLYYTAVLILRKGAGSERSLTAILRAQRIPGESGLNRDNQ